MICVEQVSWEVDWYQPKESQTCGHAVRIVRQVEPQTEVPLCECKCRRGSAQVQLKFATSPDHWPQLGSEGWAMQHHMHHHAVAAFVCPRLLKWAHTPTGDVIQLVFIPGSRLIAAATQAPTAVRICNKHDLFRTLVPDVPVSLAAMAYMTQNGVDIWFIKFRL